MSSILCSQGMVLATAMAVSGTVILLALRLQKTLAPSQFTLVDQIPRSSQQVLRSCISSEGKKKKRKKKRVHFAEDAVDPGEDGEEFRRQHDAIVNDSGKPKKSVVVGGGAGAGAASKTRGMHMPANRVALYNGLLRDRVAQRLACSY